MTTKRILTLATVSALAVAATTIVATAAFGAGGSPDEVRLHLGNDSQQFVFGSATQNVAAKSNGNCTIKDTPPPTIMNYSVTGSRATPGFNKLGIGVSSGSNPNGTPCAQVESTESLTLTGGTALNGALFYKVRLDLEMTGNAVVQLTFARVAPNGTVLQTLPPFTLQTGPSSGAADQVPPYEVTTGPGQTTGACAAASSSGPNSTINDNCEWTVEPGINFNRITLATTTPGGTVSLEGGSDFNAGSDRDSVFYIAANGTPTLTNDTLNTTEDPSPAPTINVLANDTDPDGDALTAALVPGSGPSHGTVALTAPGTFTYTPNANYNGPDSFQYTASDGTNTAGPATVSITVAPVNDAPVAVNDTLNTTEDPSPAPTINVLANDTDVDSNTLTAAFLAGFGPSHGSVALTAPGIFTYTPDANYNGSDSFKYTASDGSLSSTATVTINVASVNDAPVANDDSGQINQNQLAAGETVTVSVLGNDTDIENDALHIDSFTQGALGSVAVNANTLVYTPGANFHGSDTFTYRAADSGGAVSNAATVTITEVICTNETVTDNDNGVIGTFTRLGDTQGCKRFSVDAQASDSEIPGGGPSITFKPEGDFKVNYRGFVTFGSSTPPVGELALHLRYDPTGGTTFQDVLWCENRVFSPTGLILSADMPNPNESWCIASVTTGGPGTDITTTWQVFGLDDPRFV